MKQLHRKLSLAMLAIVLPLGAAFYAIERVSVKLYYEELSQRLNSSLAMYVTDEKPLISDGAIDEAALAESRQRQLSRLAQVGQGLDELGERQLLQSAGDRRALAGRTSPRRATRPAARRSSWAGP